MNIFLKRLAKIKIMEVISNGRENNLFGSLISFLSFSKFHASILITQEGGLSTIGQKKWKNILHKIEKA